MAIRLCVIAPEVLRDKLPGLLRAPQGFYKPVQDKHLQELIFDAGSR